MRLLLRWVLASVALLITIKVVPGLSFSGSPWGVFLATLVLGLLNALATPFLFLLKIITLPLSCLTLGLWSLFLSLIVNILIFQFVAGLGWGFKVDSFKAAALGALVMSVLTAVLSGLFHLGRRK